PAGHQNFHRQNLLILGLNCRTWVHTGRSHEQVRPRCLEGGLQLPGGRPDLAVHERELDIRVVELLSVVPLAELEVNCCGLDDLNAGEPHTVTRGHLGVHLLHSTIQSSVTVFLVHVVVTCSALVTQPDAVVLDRCRVTLKDLRYNQNV
ncbi:Os05g0565050, partial [Oryza sativa Japonica Group]